jgi:hypothetical protein
VNLIKNVGPSGCRFYDGLTPQLNKNCTVMNFSKEPRKEDVQRIEENRIPKRVLYMNLETRRQRNRWQAEVKEDGRIVGGEVRQERLYNREEWKKLLRTATNCRILHMPME